jgi:hypothetical protein
MRIKYTAQGKYLGNFHYMSKKVFLHIGNFLVDIFTNFLQELLQIA